jgi:hypothetical protein
VAALGSHPELKLRLVKENWYAAEKIEKLYQVDRLQPMGISSSRSNKSIGQLVNGLVVITLRYAAAQLVLKCD